MGQSRSSIYTPFSYNSVICRHIKRKISLECHIKRKISLECRWVRAEDVPFVSGVVVSCWCHWESRPQEGDGIAQAWATWPEGASAPNGTVKCTAYPRW